MFGGKSVEAECSVNPANQLAIFTINFDSAAPKYEVKSDTLADVEQFYYECSEGDQNSQKHFFDLVSHCQQFSDDRSEEVECSFK